MADRTIAGQRWPEGTTVNVYPAGAWTDRSRSPVGAAVTSGTVSAGSVTFTGLTEGTQYVAYAPDVGVTFMPETEALQTPTISRARTDRERIRQLEIAQESGGGGTGGGHQIEFNGDALTQREVLNFTGAGVEVADSAGETVVTVAGASVNSVLFDATAGEWPARPTDDETISYIWIGPTFPTVGGAGGFISAVDVYIPNAEVSGGGGGSLEWVKATLSNGWAHYQETNPTDGPFFRVQYAIDGATLHLKGMADGSGASSGTIMLLPVDARPALYQRLTAVGPGTSPGTPVAVQVEPGGVVKVSNAMGFVFLDGLTFSLDADPFA